MAIAKSMFNDILSQIFKKGNKIELFSQMPNPDTEAGAVKLSGNGYTAYTIDDNDFYLLGATVQSNKNLLLYLSEGSATAVGFGVYSEGKLLYFGEFAQSMNISYNTVPTIKKYNGSNEGIQITITNKETTEQLNATAE